MLSGERDPPESLASEEDMLKKVAETSGAVGSIKKDNVVKDVKILLIIED